MEKSRKKKKKEEKGSFAARLEDKVDAKTQRREGQGQVFEGCGHDGSIGKRLGGQLRKLEFAVDWVDRSEKRTK